MPGMPFALSADMHKTVSNAVPGTPLNKARFLVCMLLN